MRLEDTFIQLIKEHEAVIFKITSVYARNAEDQQDLYQEIVAQLWSAYSRFRGEAKASTWIYRIALNTAITMRRKNKKKLAPRELDWVLRYTHQQDPLQQERIQLLYRKIEQLNELEKGIILLFLEDKTYEEIAAITGLTLTNVATRLSRIRQKLKSQLQVQPKLDRNGAG